MNSADAFVKEQFPLKDTYTPPLIAYFKKPRLPLTQAASFSDRLLRKVIHRFLPSEPRDPR